MQAVTQILTVTIKELRELLHRPVLVLTLILGPLAILIIFGIWLECASYPSERDRGSSWRTRAASPARAV